MMWIHGSAGASMPIILHVRLFFNRAGRGGKSPLPSPSGRGPGEGILSERILVYAHVLERMGRPSPLDTLLPYESVE